jgi:hypothetical protein
MQISPAVHLYSVYSHYRIGSDDDPPCSQQYTNITRPASSSVTQLRNFDEGGHQIAGGARVWYDGFTSLPPGPRHEGM